MADPQKTIHIDPLLIRLDQVIHELPLPYGEAASTICEVAAELRRLRQWVKDLQSGMYINCVYCGHRYGPKNETPDSMADVLKAHIEQCPQHPLSAVTAELAEVTEGFLRYAVSRTLDGKEGHYYWACRACHAEIGKEPHTECWLIAHPKLVSLVEQRYANSSKGEER